MQLSKQGINRNVEKKIFSSLYQALADITNPQNMELFFNDILTPMERAVVARRLAIAWYLKQNKSYGVIKTDLKVSSATIATVQEQMAKGNTGLNLALKTIEADEWAGELANKILTSVKNLFKKN